MTGFLHLFYLNDRFCSLATSQTLEQTITFCASKCFRSVHIVCKPQLIENWRVSMLES